MIVNRVNLSTSNNTCAPDIYNEKSKLDKPKLEICKLSKSYVNVQEGAILQKGDSLNIKYRLLAII